MPSPERRGLFCEALGTQVEGLCEAHYHIVYRHLHTPITCADCGAKPKARQNAHSPDAITVSEYLSANTEFSVEILPTDIMLSKYKLS